MTIEEIKQIFDDINPDDWDGDGAFKGLQILSKYTDDLIQGAGRGIIYSEDIEVLIKKGITKEDVIKLANLNWMENNGHMACHV